jgi:hypothetical protein
MTKCYLPNIRIFIFFSHAPIYISDELVVAFLVFFIISTPINKHKTKRR